MRFAVLMVPLAFVVGCSHPPTGEQIADNLIKEMASRVRRLDTSKPPPAIPLPENPPRKMDLAKIAAESKKITSLKIETITVGSGPLVQPGKEVAVHFVGTLPDGFVFDTSYKDKGEPLEFKYDPMHPVVIKGWILGLEGMRVGGRRKLTIPASLAYGAAAPPGSPIPPNAALIYDLQLVYVGDEA
jgi:FKBP-type peptidyl-prolyl cis-trans isomerase